MDFRARLQKATERGQRTWDNHAKEEVAKALSQEEFKRLHSNYRRTLTGHIEDCLEQLADHFPGFSFKSVIGDSGWGAMVTRDDIGFDDQGKRNKFFSRLEMVVCPHNKFHVLDLAAKGTIRNKEVYQRNKYQLLSDMDLESFTELVDLWILEYAELFAATR